MPLHLWNSKHTVCTLILGIKGIRANLLSFLADGMPAGTSESFRASAFDGGLPHPNFRIAFRSGGISLFVRGRLPRSHFWPAPLRVCHWGQIYRKAHSLPSNHSERLEAVPVAEELTGKRLNPGTPIGMGILFWSARNTVGWLLMIAERSLSQRT